MEKYSCQIAFQDLFKNTWTDLIRFVEPKLVKNLFSLHTSNDGPIWSWIET